MIDSVPILQTISISIRYSVRSCDDDDGDENGSCENQGLKRRFLKSIISKHLSIRKKLHCTEIRMLAKGSSTFFVVFCTESILLSELQNTLEFWTHPATVHFYTKATTNPPSLGSFGNVLSHSLIDDWHLNLSRKRECFITSSF